MPSQKSDKRGRSRPHAAATSSGDGATTRRSSLAAAVTGAAKAGRRDQRGGAASASPRDEPSAACDRASGSSGRRSKRAAMLPASLEELGRRATRSGSDRPSAAVARSIVREAREAGARKRKASASQVCALPHMLIAPQHERPQRALYIDVPASLLTAPCTACTEPSCTACSRRERLRVL